MDHPHRLWQCFDLVGPQRGIGEHVESSLVLVQTFDKDSRPQHAYNAWQQWIVDDGGDKWGACGAQSGTGQNSLSVGPSNG
jgi:hypothetical protein